jgi:predicted neutral ceramidase superfamily lipid hydrolase
VHPVFRRHIVIGDALFRQNRADPDVLTIAIGRAVLFDDVTVEARALIDAQNAGDAADHAADHATNDGAYRAGSPFALSRASFNSARNALGLGYDRKRHHGEKGGYPDKTANHGNSNAIV